jgi:hypothetical protein
MGFIDKMCYEVATDIINNIFWVNYEPTIEQNKTWYENLNKFLVKEWNHLQKIEDIELKFTRDEEEMIVRDAFNIFFDKIGIDNDAVNEFRDEVDWSRFVAIIGHYTLLV